jgi:enoyl-CoA hydratase/carnithine racemase
MVTRRVGRSAWPRLANLEVELQNYVAIVRLVRPAKRNALNDETGFSLERWFSDGWRRPR